MANEHQSDRIPEPEVRGPGRGRLILGVALGVLAVAGLLVAAITLRNDSSAIASRTEPPAPSMTSPPTSTAGLRTELVARLESILRQREEAYHKRDTTILHGIYTTDCPCLESDSNAIRELLDKEYVWVGGATSIQVQRLERVSDRLWLIVATFSSEALRIETESGRLIRNEPKGSDLFQFALVKPVGSTEWLLGRASSYQAG
jgi:hypothetical protein